MLRRTLLRRSGGHGDLFPTTKEAAHLTPRWLMARPSPPSPGAGRCYVAVTRPEVRRKWQLIRPEVHTITTAPLRGPLPHHCNTRRPNEKAVAATLVGVRGALDHHAPSEPHRIAAANVAEKERSEAHMKTRDYAAHKRPINTPPGWERQTDMVDLTEWMHKRINDHRKIVNDNPKGYEKEYMIWERKPDPPASAVKK